MQIRQPDFIGYFQINTKIFNDTFKLIIKDHNLIKSTYGLKVLILKIIALRHCKLHQTDF